MASRFPALQQNNYRRYFQSTDLAQQSIGDLEGIMQKAQYDTADAAALNSVFTAVLYEQYNKENQFLATLPQVDRSGEITSIDGGTVPGKAFRAAHSPVPLQTHPEGGAVPDGEKFSVEQFEAAVKRSETVLEVSDLQQIRGAIEDAVDRDDYAELQEAQLDLAIDRDALAAPALESDSAYADTDEITPLDRVIASSDEEGNATDTSGTAYTDGALDYGTIDRSADTWADSYVDHNSGTLRQLTKDLMDSFIDNFVDYGSASEEDIVLLTGRDSARVLSEIQKDSSTVVQFDAGDGATESAGDDAETVPGLPGTTRMRQYDDIPIVPNQNCPADSLSRIYALDMSTINGEPKIAIEQYAEPYTETAGRGQPQGYIAQGNYREKMLFMLNHEVMVRDFGSLGKLRDIQA